MIIDVLLVLATMAAGIGATAGLVAVVNRHGRGPTDASDRDVRGAGPGP